MATYLLYHRNGKPGANSTRRNAVLASGANPAAARAAANAAAKALDGNTRVRASWAALEIAGADDLDAPIWFRGTAAEPLQKNAGR